MGERVQMQREGLRSPARVLLVMDQPVLAEVVKFALNHGVFVARVVPDAQEAQLALRDWQPHLALLDMDLCEGGTGQDDSPGRAPAGHWTDPRRRSQDDARRV